MYFLLLHDSCKNFGLKVHVVAKMARFVSKFRLARLSAIFHEATPR